MGMQPEVNRTEQGMDVPHLLVLCAFYVDVAVSTSWRLFLLPSMRDDPLVFSFLFR
jgi:hypothetical protein